KAASECRRRADPGARHHGRSGMNPGDRRAVSYLMRRLRPSRVLELTVDIKDVNDSAEAAWKAFRLRQSPRDAMRRLSFGGLVRSRWADHSTCSVRRDPRRPPPPPSRRVPPAPRFLPGAPSPLARRQGDSGTAGALPWPTKLGSSMTSLAMLGLSSRRHDRAAPEPHETA
ncbi:MAG TPA: hypothetical protein VFS38_06660, partial [Actinomycetota bacterium]|nr:hypothetical protein [Actinomycetota bacterium]